MNTRIHRRPATRRGFTLAEMMVVIVIIGLLATLVVPNVLQRLKRAYMGKVKADIVTLEMALDDFAMNNGMKYPDSLEVLVTPDVNGETYIKQTVIPKDPWGKEYVYEAPGPGQPRAIVRTYGKDGQLGGEGEDADIDNITIREGK